MRDETFRLITLGQLALIASDGSEDASLSTRRRKLALLAVLATAGRPLSRAVLAEMFWGDQDEERARHSLSDALSHLRRVLGRDAIASRQTDVWIAPDCKLSVDVLELTAAAATRDTARVVELYGGPFMDGVSVPRSCTFEQWVARERDRLERLFLAACDGRCFSLARSREWDECATLAARWLGMAPLSVDAALYRLNALKAPLTRDAYARALVAYDRLVRRLRDEYTLAPDSRVTALATDIAASLRSTPAVAEAPAYAAVAVTERAPIGAAPAPDVAHGAAAPESFEDAVASATDAPHAAPAAPARLGRAPRWVAVAGSIAITLLLAAPSGHHGRAPLPNGEPVVAVAPVRVVGADASSAWIGIGIAQFLAADLADSAKVTVVPPERVLNAEGGKLAASDDATRALAERLGATWIVDGGLVHGDTLYLLDVSVREASSGRVVQLFTVTGRDMAGLARQAAKRLRSTALQPASGALAGGSRQAAESTAAYAGHS
ncbi:MAG TPA: BTAD domain-containing putative transcriptional regulator [Gemmatimonadaceae bacterium]